MAELPEWIRKAKERADKATSGPWVSITGDGPFGTQSNVRTTEGWPEVIASRTIVGAAKPVEQQESNFAFIAHARMDVPQLVELVGEIVGVLEAFRDTDCQRMGCMQCRDDVCLSKLWGRLDDALAKYHGEAESE